MSNKIIVVGGVATGASCAARLRRLDEKAEIIIVEKSNFVSYANCGLPYYLGKEIEEFDELIVQSPRSLLNRFNLDVRVSSCVTSIDTKEKTVTIVDNEKEYKESYDYLVLAPGCKPKNLFEGSENLACLRNVDDVKVIEEDLKDKNDIAIIGGGFIGVELAENLKNINKDVTILEYANHLMTNLDEDIVCVLEKKLKENNINVSTSARIVKVEKNNDKYLVTLGDGEVLTYDYVISCTGVEPNTEFIKGSGIELDESGYINVNEHLQTNVENVYAGGDAIGVENYITHQKTYIPLAGPANKHGRIIANNIAGYKTVYDGSIGTSIIKVFDLAAGSTGLKTNDLKKMNINYETICLHPYSHATYYPGGCQFHAKLFYDKSSKKVLGCQAIGKEGIDKLIDVVATVIKLNGTVEDLTRLELAYAPPFLSAKSPANYFGFVAENVENGIEELVTVQDSVDESNKNIILDVRTNGEYEKGHFENAVHMPVDEIRSRVKELDQYKDQVLDVYCAVGIRAHIASRILRGYGFKTRIITGSYTTFKNLYK